MIYNYLRFVFSSNKSVEALSFFLLLFQTTCMDGLPLSLPLSFSVSIFVAIPHRFIRSGLKGRSHHTVNAGCWCLADHVVCQEDAAPHKPVSERRSLVTEHLTLSLSHKRTG